MTFYENIFSFFHLLVDRNKIYHFLFNFLKILIQCHDANWDYQKLAISIFKAIFFLLWEVILVIISEWVTP